MIDGSSKSAGQGKGRVEHMPITVVCVLRRSLLCPRLYHAAILRCLSWRKSGRASLSSFADGLHPPLNFRIFRQPEKQKTGRQWCLPVKRRYPLPIPANRGFEHDKCTKPKPSPDMDMAAKIGNGYHLDQLPWSRLTILAYGRGQIQ